jgi:hypothetical protein
MKTLLFTLSLAVAGVGSSYAQSSPSAVASGTVLGSIAGALIGGHNHDHWAEGAVIGAAAGALIGSAVEPAPRVVVSGPPVVRCAPAGRTVYVTRPAPAVRVVYVNRRAPAPVVVIRAPHRGRHLHRRAYVAPVIYYGR